MKHWEVGNELWGRWQVNWTTGEGYADRFKRFSAAMLAVDPRIRLYACGAPVQSGKRWNDALLGGASSVLHATTDHPLIGGNVSLNADPLDVFRDFMAVPDMLEKRWAARRSKWRMPASASRGWPSRNSRCSASLGRVTDGAAPPRMTATNLVNPGTLAEALYDVLFYHSAVRLAPFVEMVTHSATVNHGGGLRKEHEGGCTRILAITRPGGVSRFSRHTPVTTEAQRAPRAVAPRVAGPAEPRNGFGDQDGGCPGGNPPDGDLLLSVYHRAGSGSTRLSIEVSDFAAGKQAEVWTLSGKVPWDANTLAEPTRSSLSKASWKCSAMPPRASCWNCPRIPSLHRRVPKQRAAAAPSRSERVKE